MLFLYSSCRVLQYYSRPHSKPVGFTNWSCWCEQYTTHNHCLNLSHFLEITTNYNTDIVATLPEHASVCVQTAICSLCIMRVKYHPTDLNTSEFVNPTGLENALPLARVTVREWEMMESVFPLPLHVSFSPSSSSTLVLSSFIEDEDDEHRK